MRSIKVTPTITSYEDKSFSKYLDEISKIKQLTVDEEAELGPRLLAGDREAIETIVKANLRFVISVANQYVSRQHKLEDLVTEGNIGLYIAAQRFDYSRGFKFISYAVWYIRKQIGEYCDNNSRMVRLPINKINSIKKIKAKKKELEQELGREVTIEELYHSCSELNLDMEDVDELMGIESNMVTSYDVPVGEGESETILNFLPNHDELSADFMLDKEDMNNAVNTILSELKPKERKVIEMIYGVNHNNEYTVREIAEEFDMTSESIRQIKIKALKKLTTWFKTGRIVEY